MLLFFRVLGFVELRCRDNGVVKSDTEKVSDWFFFHTKSS